MFIGELSNTWKHELPEMSFYCLKCHLSPKLECMFCLSVHWKIIVLTETDQKNLLLFAGHGTKAHCVYWDQTSDLYSAEKTLLVMPDAPKSCTTTVPNVFSALSILWIIHPCSSPPQQTPLNYLTQQTQSSLISACEGLVAVTMHCIAIICREGDEKCMWSLSADHWTIKINLDFYEVKLFKVIFDLGHYFRHSCI